ncbi:MAG: endonuclease/exonuclease/phosphatase family protein [Bacteroidales bacterium]
MRKILLQATILFVALFIGLQFASAQEKQYKVGCIAFYNLENLYDTINDPDKNDEEFLPTGKNNWNSRRYAEKLDHLSQVISQIGSEYAEGCPVLVGLSEVENINVVNDLINQAALKSSDYGIVHYDSPDLRGIDVALIYQKQHFTVTSSKPVKLTILAKPDWKTRDQLVVAGIFDGEPLYIIVNHWPSRSGGEKKSAPLRNAAADLCKSIVDSIQNIDSTAKIIIMGDLNDDPTNNSLVKHLKAKSKIDETREKDLFNTMYNMFKKEGIGSLAYKDNWNLFDQIIVSGTLLGKDKSTYKFFKAKIFNKNFLVQKEGAFAGYPFRTYAGGVYLGGYSDHFPAYIFLVKDSK